MIARVHQPRHPHALRHIVQRPPADHPHRVPGTPAQILQQRGVPRTQHGDLGAAGDFRKRAVKVQQQQNRRQPVNAPQQIGPLVRRVAREGLAARAERHYSVSVAPRRNDAGFRYAGRRIRRNFGRRFRRNAGMVGRAGLHQMHHYAPGPLVDIVLPHGAPHPAHPLAALRIIHRERPVNSVRELLSGVGVDNQRVGKLLGRAGESAQYQHAVIVNLGSHIFLGHEVHSVVQTAFGAETGQPAQCGEGRRRQGGRPIQNGLPPLVSKAPVDAIHRSLDVHRQLHIGIDVGPAGGAGLQKYQPPPILRPFLQQPFHGPQPMGNPLGVVLPVDAQPQDAPPVETQLPGQALHFGPHFLSARFPVQMVKVNADGKGPHQRGLVPIVNQPVSGVNPGVQVGRHAIHKVLAIAGKVKAQQVVAQHPVQDFRLPGADAENVRAGPGNVPELPDDHILVDFPYVAGQQRQVIILYQHNRRVAADFVQHQIREAPVDRLVKAEVSGVKQRLRIGDMAQRP